MVGGDALAALDEAVHYVTDGDVQVGSAADAVTALLEELFDLGREGVLESWRQSTSCEFFLNGQIGLLAPDRELRWHCKEHNDQLLLAQDRVAEDGVQESLETSSAFLNKSAIIR